MTYETNLMPFVTVPNGIKLSVLFENYIRKMV